MGSDGAEPPPLPEHQVPGLGPWCCTYIVWCSYVCVTKMSTTKILLSPDVFFSGSKCTKTHFGCCSAPHRARRAYDALQTPSQLRRLNIGAWGASPVSPNINSCLRHWLWQDVMSLIHPQETCTRRAKNLRGFLASDFYASSCTYLVRNRAAFYWVQ